MEPILPLFDSVKEVLEFNRNVISRPFFVYRPHSIRQAVQTFKQLNAQKLFAVKTNPNPRVIHDIYHAGITSFDVASLTEIHQIRESFPDAELFYMHPVKSRHSIREAYFNYRVKHYSLDSEAELQKIVTETQHANDLGLHMRIDIPNNYAELGLAGKFGANLQDAAGLLKKIALHAHKIGICFHVGSQCMHPDAYRVAIRIAAEVLKNADINIDYFNIGGGFPSIYPGMNPPALEAYFEAIHEEFYDVPNFQNMQLLSEPGRAIVAESMSLITQVDLRKRNELYINEGTYGSLFDAGIPKFVFPVKLICDREIHSTDLAAFSFYGPTCDSLDYMEGPFYLPSDINEGDYIEIGQLGAYGQTMSTSFNGFCAEKDLFIVTNEPLMSMYGNSQESYNQIEHAS